MKTSDDLFQLIKLLSKSQKRYFKLFASLHSGDKAYLKLFDAFDKQKSFDEDAVKKQFHKDTFVKHLARTKNYLYQLILKSMRSYHSQETMSIQLKGLLNDIAFLFDNGLYKQCHKLLVKTKQMAIKYDKHLPLLELLTWEFQLMRVQAYQGKTEKDVEKIANELFQVIEKYKSTNEYSFTSAKLIMTSMRKGFPRDEEGLVTYQHFMDEALLHTKNFDVSSFSSTCSVYYSNMFLAYLKNNYEQAYNFAQKLVTLIEENPHQIVDDPRGYISALHALMVYQGHLEKHAETFSTLKKFEKIDTKSKQIKNSMYWAINSTELATYISIGDFAKGVELSKKIENELKKSEVKILSKQDEAVLDYNIACIYLGVENYKTANTYLNKILNDTTIDLRTDLHCFARILSLIVHAELGNADLLEYAVKSTYRYLYTRHRLYQFETVILNFIRNLSKINSQKRLITTFKELKVEIEQIVKIPFENKVLDYFDFVSWLESKIEGKPFAEVVKEKVNAHWF